MKSQERALPMPPNAANQELSPQGQMSYFLHKQVRIEYNGIDKLVVATGRLLSVTGQFIVILTAVGTQKLIYFGTGVSIEETKVDQSLLAS